VQASTSENGDDDETVASELPQQEHEQEHGYSTDAGYREPSDPDQQARRLLAEQQPHHPHMLLQLQQGHAPQAAVQNAQNAAQAAVQVQAQHHPPQVQVQAYAPPPPPQQQQPMMHAPHQDQQLAPPIARAASGESDACGPCDAEGSQHEGSMLASSANGSNNNLSLLHACVHCRASKTACADERPCARCRRLNLECSTDDGQPRKRACKSCHAAKVACGTLFTEACNRCRRLGFECVPRDPPGPPGQRRRRVRSSRSGAEAAAAAAAAGATSLLLESAAYADASVAYAQDGTPMYQHTGPGGMLQQPTALYASPMAAAGGACLHLAGATAQTVLGGHPHMLLHQQQQQQQSASLNSAPAIAPASASFGAANATAAMGYSQPFRGIAPFSLQLDTASLIAGCGASHGPPHGPGASPRTRQSIENVAASLLDLSGSRTDLVSLGAAACAMQDDAPAPPIGTTATTVQPMAQEAPGGVSWGRAVPTSQMPRAPPQQQFQPQQFQPQASQPQQFQPQTIHLVDGSMLVPADGPMLVPVSNGLAAGPAHFGNGQSAPHYSHAPPGGPFASAPVAPGLHLVSTGGAGGAAAVTASPAGMASLADKLFPRA
jgi:hypothetical protein